jgi:hypothetical protein
MAGLLACAADDSLRLVAPFFLGAFVPFLLVDFFFVDAAVVEGRAPVTPCLTKPSAGNVLQKIKTTKQANKILEIDVGGRENIIGASEK